MSDQSVVLSKTFFLQPVGKTPNILVYHLERFSSSGFHRVKFDVKVNFPVEGLDLAQCVRKKEGGKLEVYDLISVVEHFGGLNGGHYTASAKNFADGRWHHYDDGIVEVLETPNSVVRAAAYILFARRR